MVLAVSKHVKFQTQVTPDDESRGNRSRLSYTCKRSDLYLQQATANMEDYNNSKKQSTTVGELFTKAL